MERATNEGGGVMKKTLKVNGVIVGEVEVPEGDIQGEVAALQQFLRQKGLDREVTPLQAIFRQARCFATTAQHLYDGLKGPARNHLNAIPFVVNSAFCIELYLKTLYQVQGERRRGHRLLVLFDELPEAIRDAVVDAGLRYQNERGIKDRSADGFRQFIADLDDAFTQWRYCHEVASTGTGVVHIEPSILVMRALDQVCRDSGAT
jgi:hypothetical protein